MYVPKRLPDNFYIVIVVGVEGMPHNNLKIAVSTV